MGIKLVYIPARDPPGCPDCGKDFCNCWFKKMMGGRDKSEMQVIDPRDIHDAVLPEVVGDYEAVEA